MRQWFLSTFHPYSLSTLPSLPLPLQLESGPLLGPEALRPREQLGRSAGHGQAPVPSTPCQAGSHRPGAVPDPRCSSETPQSSVGTATESHSGSPLGTLLLALVTTPQISGTLDCEQELQKDPGTVRTCPPTAQPLTCGSGVWIWNMDPMLASLPRMFSHRTLLPRREHHGHVHMSMRPFPELNHRV